MKEINTQETFIFKDVFAGLVPGVWWRPEAELGDARVLPW